MRKSYGLYGFENMDLDTPLSECVPLAVHQPLRLKANYTVVRDLVGLSADDLLNAKILQTKRDANHVIQVVNIIQENIQSKQ